MPRLLCLAALAALLACSTAAVPAGAAARSTCQRLKGKDLAPSKTVKLVRRANDSNATDLVGCILPRGRLRTIVAGTDQDTLTIKFTIRQVAGRIVLFDTTYASQYGLTTRTDVTDVRTGRSYFVAYQCTDSSGYDCSYTGGPTVARTAFLTKAGRAVAAIAGVSTGERVQKVVTITAFDPAGARRTLDSGSPVDVPAASLRLTGTRASWTHDGAPRSADISAPG